MSYALGGDIFGSHPVVTCVLSLILGLCVGSFLNVLALRSLKEQSVFWPASHCPRCSHSLPAWDNIPLLSYFLLGGRCRYCREPISFQYPLVEFVTGIVFLAIAFIFLLPPMSFDSQLFEQGASFFDAVKSGTVQHIHLPCDTIGASPIKIGLVLGLVALSCTLIAVTVTDFKEKLIPHEITYPSMIVGLLFSALVRRDLLGALAGVGASYIIFDFLAFYGLKFYLATHKSIEDNEDIDEAKDDDLDSNFGLPDGAESEPLEVMGGGDAVLSAVMSAYLGWQMLVVALGVGFVVGTVMGLALLLVEMKKSGILLQGLKRSLVWALIAASAVGALTFAFETLLLQPGFSEIAYRISGFMAAMAALSCALLGLVSVGTQVSKPFPFGPPLAFGGFVAMFLIPYWLPFN